MKKNIMLGDMRSRQVKIPEVGKIKIEHKNNITTITTTDLECLCNVSWEDKEVGDYIGMIDDLPKTDVPKIKLIEGGLELKDTNGVAYKIDFSKDVSPYNYPEHDFESNYSFRISNGVLQEALTATLKAVSKDKTRPALTAIRLDSKNDKLRFTATDGYKLVEYQTDTFYNENETALLPSNTAKKLLKILKQYSKDDEIEAELNDDAICFTTPQDTATKLRFELYSNLVYGGYPDTDTLIRGYDLSNYIEVRDTGELVKVLRDLKDEPALKLMWEDDELVFNGNQCRAKIGNSTLHGDITDMGYYDPKLISSVLPTGKISVKMYPNEEKMKYSMLVEYKNITALVMGLMRK